MSHALVARPPICKGKKRTDLGTIDRNATRDLKRLRGWMAQLLSLAKRVGDDVRYSEDDHLGFMALCFLSKQVDHAGSVLALVPRRDTILIARSMIEGLSQLLWAAGDPKVLPLRWRAFAWIHDWRIEQKSIARGEPIDPERHAEIETGVRLYGDRFLTGKARAAGARGMPLPPDPYYHTWRCGRPIEQICEAVGGEAIYRKLYEPFSDWHHWGVGGIAAAIVRRDYRVAYSSLSPVESASALAVACQCVLQTLQLVDRHLEIGLTSQIDRLRDAYVADMS